MIVLDEQLLGRGIADDIARWYQGRVEHVIDLRPGSVIKDDAIAGLLQSLNGPTFITINVWDFWRKVAAHRNYCIVCFVLPDARAVEIPLALRDLFRRPGMATKRERMGKVVRIADQRASYYSLDQPEIGHL